MYLKIFITIIISLLIIFYILECLGIIRYVKLHFFKIEDYIPNYKNLKKTDNKVILSFTTKSKNINKIKPMLNSILDQTIQVDQLILNIYNESEYDIPEEYKKIMNIFNCEKDYGCASKFIPTILRQDSNDSIIILLDDKSIYGKDFLEKMIDEYNEHKMCIISKDTVLFTPDLINVDKINSRHNEITDQEWIKDCINGEKREINYKNNL